MVQSLGSNDVHHALRQKKGFIITCHRFSKSLEDDLEGDYVPNHAKLEHSSRLLYYIMLNVPVQIGDMIIQFMYSSLI